jgi:hypothetical protein
MSIKNILIDTVRFWDCENGGFIRLLTSFPKSAFWEYMLYETQHMYSR